MIEVVQFISQSTSELSHLEGIEKACQNGVKWIQLRLKEHSFEELIDVGFKAKEICTQYGAKLIINDNVAAAIELNTCGVHLGKQDMPVTEARKLLGEDKIIGATANTFADIQHHVKSGANYVGLGPFRFTTTKENLSPVLGLGGYKRIVNQCVESGINIPIIAIGGIESEDVSEIIATGVYGIAVSGLIVRTQNPKELIADLYRQIEQTKAIALC